MEFDINFVYLQFGTYLLWITVHLPHILQLNMAAFRLGDVHQWRSIDKQQFMASISLTLLAWEDTSLNVALRESFWIQLQNPMFKATMGLKRFEDILSFIKFND